MSVTPWSTLITTLWPLKQEAGTLTFSALITAGSFTMSYGGITTSSLAWNATNATLVTNVQTGLNTLLGTNVATAAVGTMTAGIGTLTIAFTQPLLGAITVTSSLTGGAVTISLTVANKGGLYGRMDRDAIGLILGSTTDAQRDALALAQIQDMAEFYRQKIILYFAGAYPETLQEMKVQYLRRVQQVREIQDYGRAVYGEGQPAPAGSFPIPPNSSYSVSDSGTYAWTSNMKPALYFFNSDSTPVNSSLLQNVASNGDYAGDISPTAPIGLYLNYGTLAAPSWSRPDSSNAIDYLANPEEIRECGFIRAMAFIKNYGVDIPSGRSLEWRYTMMPDVAKMKRDEATEREKAAFALLQLDKTGSGIVSDSDRGLTQIRKVFF